MAGRVPLGAAPELELARALPELQAAERKLRALALLAGIRYNVAPYGGIRSAARTAEIIKFRLADYAKEYAKPLQQRLGVAADGILGPVTIAAAQRAGVAITPINVWRPIAPFGSSLHNYGAAFDAYPYLWPEGRSSSWADDALDSLVSSQVPELRSGDSFGDEPHFELRLTLEQARTRWEALGGKPGIPPATVAGVVVVVILGAFLAAGGGRA